jgi:hypothetical protein
MHHAEKNRTTQLQGLVDCVDIVRVSYCSSIAQAGPPARWRIASRRVLAAARKKQQWAHAFAHADYDAPATNAIDASPAGRTLTSLLRSQG